MHIRGRDPFPAGLAPEEKAQVLTNVLSPYRLKEIISSPIGRAC